MLPFTLSAKDSILAARNLQASLFLSTNQVLTVVLLDLKDYNLMSLLWEQNNLYYIVFFCALLS